MDKKKENDETATSQSADEVKKKQSLPQDCKREASWPSVLFYIHLNILGLYGILILFTHTKLITIAFCKYFFKLDLFISNCIDLILFSLVLDIDGNLWNNCRCSSFMDTSYIHCQYYAEIHIDALSNNVRSSMFQKVPQK